MILAYIFQIFNEYYLGTGQKYELLFFLLLSSSSPQNWGARGAIS
jgi:hypothetical protein